MALSMNAQWSWSKMKRCEVVTIDVRSNDELDYGYLKMVGVGFEEQLDSQLEQLDFLAGSVWLPVDEFLNWWRAEVDMGIWKWSGLKLSLIAVWVPRNRQWAARSTAPPAQILWVNERRDKKKEFKKGYSNT
jgi:hypothetical protein